MARCAAGYELPPHGPCPKCGAAEDADGCFEYPRQLERRIAELEQQLAEAQVEVERLSIHPEHFTCPECEARGMERAADIADEYPTGWQAAEAIRAEIKNDSDSILATVLRTR